MTVDIVDQLRKRDNWQPAVDEFNPPWQWVPDHLCNLAADEIDRLRAEVELLRPSTVEELLAVYDVPLVHEIAMVLWGHHEVAAKPSHRSDDVRQLFCDANASMVLAAAIYTRVVEPLLATKPTPDMDTARHTTGRTT